MAQAARAYSEPAPRRQPERRPQPRPVFRVLDGVPDDSAAKKPALGRSLAIAGVIIVLAFVATCLCRVAVITSTVAETMRYEEIRESIRTARAAGVDLEVQHSLASSPSRIQALATQYGMVPSAKIATVEAHAMPALSSTVTDEDTSNAAVNATGTGGD